MRVHKIGSRVIEKKKYSAKVCHSKRGGFVVIPSALSSQEPLPIQQSFLMVLALGLTAMVFWIDLQLPLGVAGGVPYVAVILLTLWFPSSRSTLMFAVGCSVLTVIGFWGSPPGGEW